MTLTNTLRQYTSELSLPLDEDGVTTCSQPYTNGGTACAMLPTDADGDDLTFQNATMTSATGTLSFNNSTGTYTYTANAGKEKFDATFSVEYFETFNPVKTVRSVSVRLSGTPNQTPTPKDDHYSVKQGGTLKGVNVIAGTGAGGGKDTDPDDDSLTAALKTAPAHGTATLQSNGDLKYVPDPTKSSDVSFDYEVSDGRGGTATATVFVDVKKVNQDPVYGDVDRSARLRAKGATIDLAKLARDPEGDALRARLVKGSLRLIRDGKTYKKGAKVTIDAKGRAKVTWNAEFYGDVKFKYKLADRKKGRSPQFGNAPVKTVTIKVPGDPRTRDEHANDFGRLAFRDRKTTCHVVSPFFDTSVRGEYSLAGSSKRFEIDGLGIYLSGPGNNGIFFDPDFPRPFKKNDKLKVRCDGKSYTIPLTNSGSTRTILAENAIMANSVPEFIWIDVYLGQKKIRTVRPGTQVWASAAISNEKNLSYRWRATGGKIFNNRSKRPLWTVPKSRGLHTIYAMVTDNKGAYVQVGRTVATDGPPQPDNVEWPGEEGASTKILSEDHFLSYLFRQYRKGAKLPDDDKTACRYYKDLGVVGGCTASGEMIDPMTFKQWKAEWGFGKAGEIAALYRNDADLGLERDMHAVKRGDEVAYYVCNYSPDRPNRDLVGVKDDNLFNAVNDERFVACVAMEYSRLGAVNGGKPFTKFIIFGPEGLPLRSINLDGRGEKYVPGACVACHGASGGFSRYSADREPDPALGAGFLPFDLDNYSFSKLSKYTRDKQEQQLRKLNELILDTDPTPAARTLIKGWYKNKKREFNGDFVPSGWKSHRSLYLDVVAPSCRGCHVALPDKGKQFGSYADFAQRAELIKGYVCGYRAGVPDHLLFTMPNALATFNRFWEGGEVGHQPDLMAKFLIERKLLKPGSRCIPPK